MKLEPIDYLAPDGAERFVESLRVTGFGVLKNHPIQKGLVDTIYDEWQAFFDASEKNAFHFNRETQDGFFPCSVSEVAKGHTVKDIKEYFHYYPWGQCPVSLKRNISAYYASTMAFAAELLAWVEQHSTAEVAAGYSEPLSGMVQGEGAAIFVFEELEHAKARKAEILAEVVGYAMSSDAADIVMPSKQGAERAIAGALKNAGLNPEDVGYINAHGTGTAANDKTECAAVATVFGRHADDLMISSTKSMHGHVIGGTGAVELLACIMALRDSVVAPTIGYEEADPECALDVVPNIAREASVSVALSNAFAFGGLNAVIALRKF